MDSAKIERSLKQTELGQPWEEQRLSVSLTERTEINEQQQRVYLYTDGARNQQGVAAALIARCDSIEISRGGRKLGDSCSIFQAEAIAILLALDWLRNDNHYNNHEDVCSDSRMVLQRLTRVYDTHSLTHQIKKILQSLHGMVSFLKIQAHADINGSEKADELDRATAAVQSEPIYSKISWSRYKRSALRINLDQDAGALSNNLSWSLDLIGCTFREGVRSYKTRTNGTDCDWPRTLQS